MNFHYEAAGEGPPLVFIHGLGSSGRDWELQVDEFSRSCRVITFDLRGHGQSDKPEGPYSLSMFAADTAGLLKALDIASAHIVGLSLGGAVAFQLAIDFPELVKTLVIVNSAPEFAARSFKGRMEIWKRSAIVRLLGMRTMGKVLSRRLFPKKEHGPLRALFVERWAENDPRAFLNAMRAFAGWSVKDRLGSIRCPVLVVTADQDYTPVAWKEEYTPLLPEARLVVIPDAHHAVPVEKPGQFNRVLTEFLLEHKL
jgi:pimeloyl-ACP methyl ester carboxylesterase